MSQLLRTLEDGRIEESVLGLLGYRLARDSGAASYHAVERQDIKGNTGNREGQAGQDTSEPSEEGPNLPNGYCEIIVNDDMIYKTRVKQYTSMPYSEAGTERFVRNWRETVVRVQVRDAR